LLTYEDWLECGEDEQKRVDFITRAINMHKGSDAYNEALVAQRYYNGENPTIMDYEKILYDMKGMAHVDMWTANHKIASQFFPMAVKQEVAYLLGNGIRFSKGDTSKKLGELFDQRVMRACLYARTDGQSFGFWNMDHLDVFRLTEFVPVKGAETGEIMLGIRWWRLDQTKPMRITLYELDGYTEYISRGSDKTEILAPKQPYKVTVVSTGAEGETIRDGENYDGFPIVPLYASEQRVSALHGKRNTIDAYDLITSDMVNNCDEGNLIYWVLTNCGGMDDLDDARFIEQLKTTHVTHADGDAGARAEAHTIDAPIDSSATTVDKLEARLYKDFQAFNPDNVTAANQSATAIRAAYVPLDLKCDIDIEPQVTEFVVNILKLAGIEDAPSYQRNRLINETEETQKILMQAEYLDEQYIMEKLLTINGDIDMLEQILKRRDAEDADRLKEAERRLRAQDARQAEEDQEAGQENGAVE